MKPLISAHWSRVLRVESKRWQRRLIFVLGGITVGAAAAAMALLADQAIEFFARLTERAPYVALIVTPAGFALSAFLARRYFPNCQGSGIQQAIAARQLSSHAARHRLVSLRLAVGKILLTLLGLLCGASIGREGPTVQVGASVMFAVGGLSAVRQRGLILAGAAAGLAAAFNTPLAGIVFAIEEMSRSFEQRASGLIIACILAAGITAVFLLGNYTYFGATAETLRSPTEWLAVPVCGVIGGLMGGLFSRILIAVAGGLPGRPGAWIKRFPVGFATACGLAVAVLGLLSAGHTFGSGYEEARGLLKGSEALPPQFGILKFLATTLSSISGIPGGLFSPSLAVGSGFGANIAELLTGAPFGPIVLLGMVGYFSGVVQAPITAFVIVTEMTDNHAMLMPLMATAMVAYLSSRLVCSEGVYHALARGFVAAAGEPTRGRH